MARSLRIDVLDAWYHVLNRGVERRQIFPDEGSNLHFLELLGCLPRRFGVRIHGYVLMGNHYHLQLQTPQAKVKDDQGQISIFNIILRRHPPRQKAQSLRRRDNYNNFKGLVTAQDSFALASKPRCRVKIAALWRAHCVSMCRMVGIMYSTGGWNAGKSFPTRGRTHIF
jgi:REP element-mobilizing transposase RayT